MKTGGVKQHLPHALFFSALTLLLAAPLAAADRCNYEAIAAEDGRLGDWIDKGNWLRAGARRVSAATPTRFMPAMRMTVISPSPAVSRSTAAGREADAERFERFPATDPSDGRQRDLGFLLQSRLDAEALVVLLNGQRIVERYWHGASPQAPRMLLSGTRPVLSLLGAVAISEGRLAADKSIARPIPALIENAALRKLSARRLLEGNDNYGWGVADIADWQRAGGWTAAKGDGVRAWLTRHETWPALSPNAGLPPAEGRPDDELLAWSIAGASRTTLTRLFCEQLFAQIKPEDQALWLTDPVGDELAAGLALSPRDLAKLGQLLLDARPAGKRSRVPVWLTEALLAPAKGTSAPGLAGLPAASALRYGFARLGGTGTRIALLAPYGTSLYIDFDRRLVIALAASHPEASSPLLLATLHELWRAFGDAVVAERPSRQ